MMANRVSNDQLEALLEFLAEKPAIANGVVLGTRSREAVDKQWNDLAARLNALGSGSSKSGERWKRYWADIKHKSKARLVRRKLDASVTGGDPNTQEGLSEIDQKVLGIIGERAMFGKIIHKAPEFNSSEIVMDTTGSYTQEVLVKTESLFTVDDAERDVIESETPNMAKQENEGIDILEGHSVPSQNGQCPVRLPFADRRRRRTRVSKRSFKTDPEWVMELKKSRVESDKRLSDAAMVIAEAFRSKAESEKRLADAAMAIVEGLANVTRQQTSLMNSQLELSKELIQLIRRHEK